jgi:membrane protease YdiL (CAAX protease family)
MLHITVLKLSFSLHILSITLFLLLREKHVNYLNSSSIELLFVNDSCNIVHRPLFTYEQYMRLFISLLYLILLLNLFLDYHIYQNYIKYHKSNKILSKYKQSQLRKLDYMKYSTIDSLYNCHCVPYCEEFIFRIFIPKVVRRVVIYTHIVNNDQFFICVISSLLFGLSHYHVKPFDNKPYILYTTLLGSIFYYSKNDVNDIFTPVLLHMLVNFTSIMLTYV